MLIVYPFQRMDVFLALIVMPFFTFQIHGIHGAFLHGLVGPVGASRLQKLVNQGRLPMVNVSDDGEIAELGRI